MREPNPQREAGAASCSRGGVVVTAAQARRPDVDAVATIVRRLGRGGTTVTIAMLVGEIRRETTCSRATAYRAVTDAVEAGVLQRVPRGAPPAAASSTPENRQ